MEHRGVERELKYADADHGRVRERLEELEAETKGPTAFEDNWIFDRGGELLGNSRLLRLRLDRQGARLTYKGAPTYEGGAELEGRVKVRAEHETRLEDAAALRQILEALGYEAVRRYQKYREEWRLGSIVISLDHTPIGDFVEVEGEGCETVARRLDLDPDKIEKRNYLQLYEDFLKEHPDAPPEMIFREHKDS